MDTVKKLSKGKIFLISFICAIIVLIIGFIAMSSFIVDYLWFSEINQVKVFFTELFTKLKFGIPLFVIFFLLSFIFQRVIKNRYIAKFSSTEIVEVSNKRFNIFCIILSVVNSAIITLNFINNSWYKFLEFTQGVSFNEKDPIFNNDISFYIFRLDFIKSILSAIIFIVVCFLILSIIVIFLLSIFVKTVVSKSDDESEKSDFIKKLEKFLSKIFGRDIKFSTGSSSPKLKNTFGFKMILELIKIEAVIFLSVIFLMIACTFFLKQYDLLYTKSSTLFGASYTSIHVTLLSYRIIIILSVLLAILTPILIKKKRIKTLLVFIALIPLTLIVFTIVGAIVQNFIVAPDAIEKEGKYLKNNISFTKKAYDLNKVKVKNFPVNADLTADDIKNNEATFKNIRINDYQQAKKYYNQVQNFRQYYQFNDVDVDRYFINGEYTQTFLSAREIDETKVDSQWINKHIKYTHGYGAAISRVDKVQSNGQPDVLVKDIPPKTDYKSLEISTPGIYFGELTNNYSLVDTSEREFDYPDGSSNVYTTYKGRAGIKLNFLNKILFALYEQSLKILVSSNLSDESKILINRNITDRVKKIMPALNYSDPYAVTIKGKLYWIIDGFTKSGNYPYSTPYENKSFNYVRNSVKVVIDAYNGDTSYYLVDEKDPIVNTMKKIYPTLFKASKEMPNEIRKHIRYPHTMLKIQSEIYKNYHVNDVSVFFQKEDSWEISGELVGTDEVPMTSSYYILKLPGEKKEEFVSTIPFTPKEKKNMTALFVARNDGDNYGELVLYSFPKTKTVMGPLQIEALINQDTVISKEFALWENAGSSYSRGNMFVLPVEESLVYIEPIYIESKNSAVPEVKRVIVYYKDKISYKPTLGEALDDMFGENSGTIATSDTTPANSKNNTGSSDKSSDDELTFEELVDKAYEAYNDAQEYLKNGNFSKYGEKMKELEGYLKQLKEIEGSGDTDDTDSNV